MSSVGERIFVFRTLIGLTAWLNPNEHPLETSDLTRVHGYEQYPKELHDFIGRTSESLNLNNK